VDPALVVREADLLRVADEDGTTVLMLGVFGPERDVARQLVYSPDIDPATVDRRYGFAVEQLDARGGRQTGLDPEAVAVVAKVCPQGPAAEGGLLEDDIIVRSDGIEPVTAQALARKAASKAEGATLHLTVHRGGRETDVSLTTRYPLEWPAPAEAEAHLRRVLDD
jgi:S1-C subfamily serine protease